MRTTLSVIEDKRNLILSALYYAGMAGASDTDLRVLSEAAGVSWADVLAYTPAPRPQQSTDYLTKDFA